MEKAILIYITGVLVSVIAGLTYYYSLPANRKKKKAEKRIILTSLGSWLSVFLIFMIIIIDFLDR